ncbi:MAG: AmmeMemoRadiSam system protein B [Anaerolineaceae bacterium]
MSKIADLRPSPIAGRGWYEGDPRKLAKQVDDYLSQADEPELDGEVLALIAPHAGHIYSGATAGYAFRCVKGCHFDLVAVISPLHRGYTTSPLLTTAHQAYQTPLGAIPVDHQALFALAKALEAPKLKLAAVAYDEEHSLEIELPFLQRALTGEFRLLPVMIASQEPAVAYSLGDALAEVLQGRNALMVASTDLSHYRTESEANKLDAEMLSQIGRFSPQGVFQAELSGAGAACGVAAVAAVLTAARALGGKRVHVLHHSTSGDVTGDRDQVVGYGAAAVVK